MTITISPSDPTRTCDSDPTDAASLRTELIDIHRRAGHYIAELSTGPDWFEADRITIRLIAEARAVTTPTDPVDAPDSPAIVRCRELAAAQQRMVVALEGDDAAPVDATAIVRARALLAELAELCATLRR